jgi:hypothetical protein
MDENKIKSGKEIVDDFFNTIAAIEGVDAAIANCLAELYAQKKLSDKNIINELQKMR